MTNTRFRIIQVNSQAEVDRYGVREFASEFDHVPVGLPLLLWFYDDELVAYVEVRMMPFLYPAVHPKIPPRVFLEGGRMLAEKVRQDFEGGFVIYDYRSALFDSEAMRHLGFEESEYRFFEPEKNHGSQSAQHTQIQPAASP